MCSGVSRRIKVYEAKIIKEIDHAMFYENLI